MNWKCVAIALIAMIVGVVVSPLITEIVARNAISDARKELFQRFSSEGKQWPEFSSFVRVGGRAYWSAEEILNNLEKGTREDEIRRLIGPPDAVLVGEKEVAATFKLGVQAAAASLDRKRLRDYIPYLDRDTAGLYVYKIGHLARSTDDMEIHVLYLELSAAGRLTDSHRIPVSASNPAGDLTTDTRSERRVGPK